MLKYRNFYFNLSVLTCDDVKKFTNFICHHLGKTIKKSIKGQPQLIADIDQLWNKIPVDLTTKLSMASSNAAFEFEKSYEGRNNKQRTAK